MFRFASNVSLWTIVAGATCALSGAEAEAEVLARYQFGTAGQETVQETGPAYAATTVAPGVFASTISEPGTIGIEISSAATTPANAPFLRVDPQGNSADAATAVQNNKYFQFSITPSAGSDVDLQNLTFDVARGGAGTPRGYAVRSSADSFTTNLASADVGTVRPEYTAVSVDLTGSSFQNLATDTPLTFRIYAYSPAGGSSVDFDNITINGTVPEPAAFALAAVAAPLLLARRRRRA